MEQQKKLMMMEILIRWSPKIPSCYKIQLYNPSYDGLFSTIINFIDIHTDRFSCYKIIIMMAYLVHVNFIKDHMNIIIVMLLSFS